MFGVMMAEDRISKQERVNEIISCLKTFPGKIDFIYKKFYILSSEIPYQFIYYYNLLPPFYFTNLLMWLSIPDLSSANFLILLY